MFRKGLAAIAAAVLGLTGAMAVHSPAVAVTDENPEFRLNKADLDFILRQIQISESHAAGNPLLCESPSDTSWTCVPDPKLAYGLRTVDGSYNNLMPNQSTYGAAGEKFPRLAPHSSARRTRWRLAHRTPATTTSTTSWPTPNPG